MSRARRFVLPRVLATVAAFAGSSLPALAATTINVTTTAMTTAADGQCSLVEAMSAARTNATVNECGAAGGPPFTINLQANQTYTATTIGSTDGQFGNSAMQAANYAIEIVGNGATITQSGQPMRLFLHNSGAFTLRNLTLAGGNAVATGTAFGEWGGAILSVFPGAVLSLEDVTIRDNQVGLEGAALYVVAQAVANLHRVTVANNEAAGGTGTAFQVRVDQAALMNVANATFDGNARAIASTSVNTAVRISSSTLRSASGVAVDLYTGSSFTLRNSIVSGGCQQSGGAFTSTNNASNSGSCAPALAVPVMGNLGNFGGRTQTLMPRLPSATKDAAGGCAYASAGTNPLFADGTALATDQRGFARSVCDVGAVEVMSVAPPTLPAGTYDAPYSATITQAGGTAPVAFAVTAGALPAGLALNAATGEISGTPTVPGTPFFTVTLTDANGFATDVRYSISIAKAGQAITFAPQASQPFLPGTTFAINPVATASSGLALLYSSLTPAVCTVAGTTVTKVAAGTCTIRASQTGNANYLAAAPVSQSLSINAVAPLAPSIGTISPGNGQLSVAFTAPSSDGGSAVTGYTATCNPGPVVATGTASPIVVPGLANGTSYTCSVTATNGIGTGPASALANGMPLSTSLSMPTATGTGTATVTLTGGGPTCTFAPPGNGPLQTAGFIPVSGHPKSPALALAGYAFPHGLLDFVLLGCAPGGTVTLAVSYPAAIDPSAKYWKYGPTPTLAAPHWYEMPATIAGSTVTFSITDGGLGDDDLAANGTIVDQGGPGVGGAAGGSSIPTLSEWAMALLAAAMLAIGIAQGRHRRA